MPTIELLFLPTPDKIERYNVHIDGNTTLETALLSSNLLKAHPDWDINTLSVGIYGKKAALNTVLKPHDRIEIYRPLQIDPKEARRQRQSN